MEFGVTVNVRSGARKARSISLLSRSADRRELGKVTSIPQARVQHSESSHDATTLNFLLFSRHKSIYSAASAGSVVPTFLGLLHR